MFTSCESRLLRYNIKNRSPKSENHQYKSYPTPVTNGGRIKVSPIDINYFRIYDIKYGVPKDREIEFPDDESSTGS